MISYKQAQELLSQQARSFGHEQIGLEGAYGRVLAEPLVADRDYPPFNRATMDGYAIRSKDLAEGIVRYEVAEVLYAGSAHTVSIVRGQCYKIMTGAPVPADADMVIRREDTEEGGQAMQIRAANAAQPFLNIAKRGEDLLSGNTVIERACICEPSVMGLLASLGKSVLTVEKRPQVALLTTGNEVVAADAPVSPVQIRNSNRWLLQSSLKKWGIVPSLYEHLPDDRELLHASLEQALTNELIILSGGVSAGDADYVPAVLAELNVRKLFHKIAVRPGKPAWCGVTPGGGIVFALPGNPFSCLVGFTLLIQPYLHACFGLPAPAKLTLPLQNAKKKKTDLDEFFPVCFAGSPSGVQPVSLNSSGDIRLGLYADALALHPAECEDLTAGTPVVCFRI